MEAGLTAMKEDKVTVEYWEDGSWFVGRIVEHPDVVACGKTLEELEASLRDAYLEWLKEPSSSDPQS